MALVTFYCYVDFTYAFGKAKAISQFHFIITPGHNIHTLVPYYSNLIQSLKFNPLVDFNHLDKISSVLRNLLES